MGGAEATGDVWVHEMLRELGIEDRVRKVKPVESEANAARGHHNDARASVLENHATIVDQEDYQLKKLRRTFRELVHQEVEAVQRPGSLAGPVGLQLRRGFGTAPLFLWIL